MEKAEGVGLGDLGQVHDPAKPNGDGRDGDPEDLVTRLGGGEEMADRADAADARHKRGHLVQRAALADPLKATELRHVEMGVSDLTRLVQLDGDLGVSFDPGDRFDDDRLLSQRWSPQLGRASDRRAASRWPGRWCRRTAGTPG